METLGLNLRLFYSAYYENIIIKELYTHVHL